MRNTSDKFGANAGKIWATLNNHGPLNQTLLIKKIKLSNNDFQAAIGWLARENKIYKEGSSYKLGETNLANKIGEDAGKIWRFLNSHGEINISSIAKMTKIKTVDAYSALGWLARENKIEAKKSSLKSNTLKFKLK